MPNDEPWLWALAIVVGAVVVVVALIKGGAVEVGLDPPTLKFRRKAQDVQERVKVLEEAEIEGEVGDISGIKRKGKNDLQVSGGREIEVGKGLKIKKGGEVGDISGINEGDSSKAKSPTKADS